MNIENKNKPAERGSSLWNDAWVRLKKNKAAVTSLFILGFIISICFVVPVIGSLSAPEDDNIRAAEHWFKNYETQNLAQTFQSSSSKHWLGSDQTGRDIFARILYGGQISILVGVIATFISVTIGVIYGAIAGYKGGKIDSLMMRIVDIFFGLPSLVLIILFSIVISEKSKKLATILKGWEWNESLISTIVNIMPLCAAIGALGWFTMARIVRAQVISTKSLEFVEAARSLGLSHSCILFKHILPNILGSIIVYTSLTIPGFILTEAALSFLGLGVQAPTPSWGVLLSESANYMETQPQLLLIPAVLFSITLLALNFLGDGLSDALDPKASKD